MYTLDTNINTAIERQADRVRAVNGYGARQAPQQDTPSAPVASRWAGKATLALAAAAPIALLVVWGLLAH